MPPSNHNVKPVYAGEESVVRFDVRPRGAGKTTDLIAWVCEGSADEYRVIVTVTRVAAKQLCRQARAMGLFLSDERCLSWEDATRRPIQPGRGRTLVIAIDNIDLVLTAMFHGAVTIATASSEELEPLAMLQRAGVPLPRFANIEVNDE